MVVVLLSLLVYYLNNKDEHGKDGDDVDYDGNDAAGDGDGDDNHS